MMKTLRFWIMWVLAIAVVAWYGFTDPDGGRETIARLQFLAWLAVAAGPAYLLRRALVGGRSHEALRRALRTSTGAGLAYLGICIVTAAVFLAFASRAHAAELPARAVQYLPTLDREISSVWVGMPARSFAGALVEQETCPSLASAKCWNPRTELKTSREYGFGLGQLTVAYRGDGSERFNAWREIRLADRELAGWQWEDRYDARLQLRAVTVKLRDCFHRLRPLLDDDYNAQVMCDAAYNGGLGGVLAERRLCAAAAGCDPDRWFGHVELHSTKSREKWRGYGASAFDINRGHVRAVAITRRPKYAQWWGEGV